MADWIYYSPNMRLASAGELLRAIPSTRIWRLERTFVEDGKDTREMVRAAEQLLDLDVTVRLQNDPGAATRLVVTEPDAEDRKAFAALGRSEFRPDQLAIVGRVSLGETAIAGGHLDIADDVACGLEQIFRKGVVHSPMTGEVVTGGELVRIMATEGRCSHIDLRLRCDPAQRAYVSRQLQELPAPFPRYLRAEGETLFLRARFPTTLAVDEIDAVCSAALELAKYARGGHVRFREQGVWRHGADDVGKVVAPPPDDGAGVFGRLSRMFRANK